MTTRVYAKHEPYLDGHLGMVGAEMTLAGAPTLPAVRYGDALIALAGSHRVAQAHHQGLIPKFVIFDADFDHDNTYWDLVMKNLPYYDFDHVLVIEEGRLFR